MVSYEKEPNIFIFTLLLITHDARDNYTAMLQKLGLNYGQ